MTTPIERLRARHQPSGSPQTRCCVVLSCGLTWPCDTIAALDALEEQAKDAELTVLKVAADLEARLDAAAVLIRQAMEERRMTFHPTGGIDTCENCAPYRAWLAGDKEDGNE